MDTQNSSIFNIRRNNEMFHQHMPYASSYQSSQKQLDAQVIDIVSSESQVQVSLSQLVPNFLSLGESLGMTSNDIYYQLKQFTFKKLFANVQISDHIELKISLTWKNKNNGNEIVTGSLVADEYTQAFFANTVQTERHTLTPQEIITYAWGDITAQALEHYNSSVIDSHATNLINFTQNVVLSYDSETKKVAFALYAGRDNLEPTRDYPDNELGGLATYRLKKISFIIQSPRSHDYTQQKRVARLWGLDRLYTSYAGQNITDPTTSYGVPIFYSAFQFTESDLDEVYLRATETDYQNFFKLSPPIKQLLAVRPMIVCPFDNIYIESSLFSNHWNQRGKKQSYTEIVPLNDCLTNNGETQIYDPSTSSSRVANARDTIGSIQQFQLNFLDDDGNDIIFLEPYLLQLVVLFKPPMQ